MCYTCSMKILQADSLGRQFASDCLLLRGGDRRVAKGKYEHWLTVDGLLLVSGWARDGLTDAQIASNMGINKATLYKWRDKYSDLRDALKKNKEVADYEVENALYKKCIGTYAREDRALKCKDVYYDEEGRRCEKEHVEVVEVSVFVPPDTTAQLAWLNNRRSDKWRRNAGKEKLDESKFEHEKKLDDKRYW